jgi:hypothetical protein
MINRTFYILLILVGIKTASAQTSKNQEGKIEIIQNKSIDSLLKKVKNQNEQRRTMPGYRIQIYSGPQRNKANEIKALFYDKYPNYGSYVIYQQPNFKVRVGDFVTRLEAYKLLKEIETEYETVYMVRDEIKINKK